MNKLTLGTVRPTIARIANLCSSSDEVRMLSNESHRRLVNKGKFVGTLAKYRICVSGSGCFAWPRQVDTIEAYWLCSTPGTVRNGFYEVASNGPGLLDNQACFSNTLVDRDPTPTFDFIDNIVSKVMVQAEVTEVATSQILLRGYDENSNWIRTQDTLTGVWYDGELVDISTNAHYTTHLFTSITEVIKPVTNGPVRLWQYDTGLGLTTKALAYYEADETLPIYRNSYIPGFSSVNGCCTGSQTVTSCTNNNVTVLVKLRHIDTVNDNDFFLLQNLGALKLMAMSILKEEKNLFSEAQAYEAKALAELQAELATYQGDGAVPIIRSESSQTWGAGVVNVMSLSGRIY